MAYFPIIGVIGMVIPHHCWPSPGFPYQFVSTRCCNQITLWTLMIARSLWLIRYWICAVCFFKNQFFSIILPCCTVTLSVFNPQEPFYLKIMMMCLTHSQGCPHKYQPDSLYLSALTRTYKKLLTLILAFSWAHFNERWANTSECCYHFSIFISLLVELG